MFQLSLVKVSLTRDNVKEQTEEEYMWLEHARRVIEGNTETDENISWSAFNASRQSQLARTISPTAQLPLFLDSAHTVAMIRHSMDVVKNAVEHMNPGQMARHLSSHWTSHCLAWLSRFSGVEVA